MFRAKTQRRALDSHPHSYSGRYKLTQSALRWCSDTVKFILRWINPLLVKGYKKDLGVKDMYRPLKKDDATLRANILTEQVKISQAQLTEIHYFKSRELRKVNGRGLAQALLRVYGGCWLTLGMVTAVEELGTR